MITGVPSGEIQSNQSLHNLYLLFTYLHKNNGDNYTNKNSSKKEKIAEKLYELSVSNASFLGRFSPTNEDLLNDSDDEGRDEEKIQKVSRFLVWFFNICFYPRITQGSSEIMCINLNFK